MSAKQRILTGDTPTGKLHIGHYVGTLENRVKLQHEYETFIVLADLHALTTKKEDPSFVREATFEVAMDNLAAGLDSATATLFVESGVPEIYELAAIMSMYITHATALRNPTIKDEIKMKGLGDVYSLGFVNYPIYQAADILCVKGQLVPVGVDQEAHLEQARELARDLNAVAGTDIFPEPKGLIGRVGKLVGTDGNPKMGKSLGNTIYLSESEADIRKKVSGMYTDPKRVRATDPGTVEGNPVFIYLDTFGKEKHASDIADFKERYVRGAIKDVEVKSYLADVMEEFIAPMRERRSAYEHDRSKVEKILQEGTEKTRTIASATLRELTRAMKFGIT